MSCIGCKSSCIRRLKNSMSKLRGPMANGDKFITLDDNYINRFDDVVVIGDIHGCCDEFEELLSIVHNQTPSKNPDKCLKILVGDLVNKGPKSSGVLRICRDMYPDSIVSVRGNHDEIVMKLHENYKLGKKLESRNSWVRSLPSRYVSYLETLPYSISIPSLNCFIVHGGINPSLEDPIKTTPTDLMTTMRNIVVVKEPGKTYYKCTKSLEEGVAWATFWPGPEHVYFGHDAIRRLQDEHEFATGLDTGCVYGDRLSAIYIKGSKKGEMINVKARKVYEQPRGPELQVNVKASKETEVAS